MRKVLWVVMVLAGLVEFGEGRAHGQGNKLLVPFSGSLRSGDRQGPDVELGEKGFARGAPSITADLRDANCPGCAFPAFALPQLFDCLGDYQVNGKKDLRCVKIKVQKHLIPFFAGKTAHGISTGDVKAFIAQRQEEGASHGEINRELSALKRAFNLALQEEKITRKPYIPRLEEHHIRQGFFEPWEFDAITPPYSCKFRRTNHESSVFSLT